ncbi:PEP/pyruvate-binding domain-containing protein [Rhodocyclaceae bacterium SMB388]
MMNAANESSFAPTTGMPGLDKVFSGVQRGDNIVWQIQTVEDYVALVVPYARAAWSQRRRLIYFRFACHPPLLAQDPGVEIHHPRPGDGFDAFVDQVHDVIETAGTETLYVFDCLSDLAEAWQSDRMMGNFFRLTCPRLFDLDTVTYFGVLRNTHTRAAMEMITDTTQFLLDVFRCRGRHYIRPIKVQHRSAAVMNLIHAWEAGDHFPPVTDSGTVSEILAGADWPGLEDNLFSDHWQRHFAAVRALLKARQGGGQDREAESEWFRRLSRLVFPDDPALMCLVDGYLDLDDLIAIRNRMIGIGAIGGKALGMLLARAVIRRDAPDLLSRMEAHDSFFVGTEVFDTFLVQNRVWWIRRRQRDPATLLSGLDEARERMLAGSFPSATIRQFEGMLDYFGEWPFIVRSSSRLEDRYGNAFAGQYDSVFCVNQGPREQRLGQLLDAVRQVYASTLGEQALRYRERRGLLAENEQMALLIMRVSGTAGSRYFNPHAAGVGLSVNPYPWNPKIDMGAGVVRIVAGLGTRAVDRSDDDYTRLIALNAPDLRPETRFGAIARHAQRRMDALDLQENRVASGPFGELVRDQKTFPMSLFTSRERDDGPAFLTFDGLVGGTPFVADMRAILERLHAAYDHAVEIEFALNMHPDGAYRINLLQCRPMQVRNIDAGLSPEPPLAAPVRVRTRGAVIGPSRVLQPDRVVYVVPGVYGHLSQADRFEIARLVGAINQASRDRQLLLLGPGRWGSRDPSLGIPVAFSEINHVAALCEIVAMHATLVPDVSLGTHFINELIEADMLYFALFPKMDGNAIDEAALLRGENRLAEIVPDTARWAQVVHVCDVEPGRLTLFADAMQQRVVVCET